MDTITIGGEILVGDEPVLGQIRKSFNNHLLLNCSIKVNINILNTLCKTECTNYFYNTELFKCRAI